MKQRIKLVIAIGNTEFTALLSEYIAGDNSIELCGIASDGTEAIELVNDKKPTVVLLHMLLAGVDGLGVMEYIKKNVADKPKIICTSVNMTDFLAKSAFRLGASYCITLPMDVSVLVQRIADVANTAKYDESIAVQSDTGSTVIDEKITSILLSIGIPANIKGYSYLREAITLAVDEPEIVNRITKSLYPAIARKFSTTPSKVERAIRHAIDVAWSRGRIKNMNDIFGIEIFEVNDRPTNGEFVALAGDRIRFEVGKSK